jgi:hypothetical protein
MNGIAGRFVNLYFRRWRWEDVFVAFLPIGVAVVVSILGMVAMFKWFMIPWISAVGLVFLWPMLAICAMNQFAYWRRKPMLYYITSMLSVGYHSNLAVMSGIWYIPVVVITTYVGIVVLYYFRPDILEERFR